MDDEGDELVEMFDCFFKDRDDPMMKAIGKDEKLKQSIHDSIEDRKKAKLDSKIDKDLSEYRPKRDNPLLGTMLGLTAMAGLTGGMLNMFGSGKGTLEVRDVIVGMVDGFIVYMDELREKIKEANNKNAELENKLDIEKEHYEEAIERLHKAEEEVKEWKSKYMKIVSSSRTTKPSRKKK